MEKDSSRYCFYSIGDDGVTALIGSSGNLFQITRFFPDRNDKTPFCVDAPTMFEPFFVTNRAKELYSRATDPYNQDFIGPAWDLGLAVSDPPAPIFINDRWPCFPWENDDGVTGITKYVIFEGTIFQTWEFDFSRTSQPVILPTVVAPRGLLLRNLDFVSCPNPFNNSSPDHFIRLSGEGFVMRGRPIDSDNDIALFIVAFSNEKRLRFVESDKGTYQLSWPEEFSVQFKKEKKFNITVAYLLDLAPTTGFNSIPISANSLQEAIDRLHPEPTKQHSFTGDTDVDVRLRRNLEHILSVCSIPVTPPKSGEIRAIALTCGDLDGHRVATAASFYCFQFLLLALKHFNSLHPNDCKCDSASNQSTNLSYVCRMRLRVQNVCQGHLKWLFERTARSKGFFAPHHWVNGEEINDWEKNEYLREKSLVDNPLHIIKAGDFFKVSRELGTSLNNIKNVVKSWIEDLDQTNKMGLYAFPHSNKEPYQKFHLTDHALIWRAIKSAEEMGLQSQLQVPSGDHTMLGTERARWNNKHKPKMYSSSLFQQNLLKRFTVKNPISKNRMLALSRSAAHNRFRLQAKDTPLFQAMHLGLFDRSTGTKKNKSRDTMIDIWRRTIEGQVLYQDSEDPSWSELLRFALCLIMAKYDKRTNIRIADDMLMHAMSVLLQSSSPNGLFPGAMKDNGEPIMFDSELMRDTYWSITFEIPYVLWAYYPRPSLSTTTTMEASQELDREAIMSLKNELTLLPSSEVLAALKQVVEERIEGEGKWAAGSFGYVKHTLPFNNVVFQENIVEIGDEWLYDKPAFFVPKQIIDDENGATGSCEPGRSDGTNSTCTRTDVFRSNINSNTELDHTMTRGVVIDVPKGKQAQKKAANTPMSRKEIKDDRSIDKLMGQGRTPENAKKRFWWFFSTAPSANQIILHTWPSNYSTLSQSFTAENGLSEFLDRHLKYAKFFFEETVPVLNIWSTEFHLSSYALGSKQDDSNRSVVTFPTSSQNKEVTYLNRTSMSFHFEGDFLDRYWTCRYLEADPKMVAGHDMEKVVDDLLTNSKSLGEADRKKAPWKQRRVLELVLFDVIVHKAQKQASQIVAEAKTIIRERFHHNLSTAKPDEPGHVDYRGFANASKQYQQVQKVLQLVDGDIAESLAKIDLWRNREKERQAERPRWTFNDESRYRSFISKLSASNSHRIQELIRTRSEIRDYIDTLSKSLEVMRNDLDQRRADDIQRFTYVTVIFLPLGFATGVFSMSQAPEGLTLAFMMITAGAALLITMFLLFNAERVESLWQRRHDLMPIGRQKVLGAGNAKKKEGRCVVSESSQSKWWKLWSYKRGRKGSPDSEV